MLVRSTTVQRPAELCIYLVIRNKLMTVSIDGIEQPHPG